MEFVDLAPTILDLLGIEPMETVQGRSLLPVIRGEAAGVKEYVFAEFLEDNKAMICNKRWKYIFTTGQRDLGQGYATGYGPSGILHRLYDLENDPGETTDLGRDPAGFRPTATAPWLNLGELLADAPTDIEGDERTAPVDLGPYEE